VKDAETQNQLAFQAFNEGKLQQALEHINQALVLNSQSAAFHYNKGNILLEMFRYEDALHNYEQAVKHEPAHAEALDNMGSILQRLGRYDEALKSHDAAIQVAPNMAKAYNNRGAVYFAQENLSRAVADIKKAIELQPDLAEAFTNLAGIYHRQGNFEQAVKTYDQSLALKPENAAAWSSRGNSLKELGQFEQALASHTRAMELAPNQQDVRYNASHLLLLLGHLKEGFYLYEDRLKSQIFAPYEKRHRELTLEKLANKQVLVEWEQGIGDNFQFCRYLPLLAKISNQVTFLAHPKMHKLLSSLGSEIRLVDAIHPEDYYDEHLPLLSLPRIFKTDLYTIPSKVPYLFVEDRKIKEWHERIGKHGFKIGICWQGSTLYKDDHLRSFPVSHFEQIAQIPDVRLISLHKGVGESQLQSLPPGMVVETFKDDFMAAKDAFLDLAAIIKNLDLVIACDTGIAHLSGALGVPTWVAIKKIPDWRWMLDRTDSPWYPNVRLFRQFDQGNWGSIFTSMTMSISGMCFA